MLIERIAVRLIRRWRAATFWGWAWYNWQSADAQASWWMRCRNGNICYNKGLRTDAGQP